MNNDELDRILAKRDEIQPSSGFAASVMDAVRNEAAAPPPIPFPWKRALPVLIFAALALGGAVIAVAVAIAESSQGPVPQTASSLWSLLSSSLPAPARGTMGTDVGWTVAALLAAFVSVKISMRLAVGRT